MDPPPDRLVCKICQLPCSKAQLSECCGHVYCQSCLYKVKTIPGREYLCPVCRSAYFKTISHHEADRTIKELKVYCPYKRLGRGISCAWVGALGDVNRHLRGCKIQCRRCGELLGYHSMIKHLAASNCLCKHCHSNQQCYCFVTCPNNCGQDVLQGELDKHRRQCPLELVECEYQCGTKIVQCEKQEHYKNCQIKHFQLRLNENLKNVYEKTEIIFDMLKQSMRNTEQITRHCRNSSENNQISLSYHMKLLLMILCLLTAILVIMMVQMQTQFRCDNADIIKSGDVSASPLQETDFKHEREEESTSHDDNYDTFNGGGAPPLQEANLKHTCEDESTSNDNNKNLKPNLFDKQKMHKHDYQILPVVFVMEKFRKKRLNEESWYSDPFFVSKDGCQMCLRVDARGYKTLRDSFVSVYLYMIKFNRRNCNWPLLRGNFAVELFNQFSNDIYHRGSMKIANNPDNGKTLNESLSFSGWGYYNFISHDKIYEHVYSGKDMLYIRILYEHEDVSANVVRASTLQIIL